MRQQYLEAPGGQVEFGVEGSGPPILYFHGTPCGNELVVTMERTLVEAGFQLIIPNRPGFYGTPLNDRTTTSDCADLAANVLRHLGVARVAVIGTSAGGPPALAFAVRYPQLTAALVLQCAQTHRWDDRRWAPSAHPWQYRLFRHIPSRWLFCKFYRTLFRLGFPTARNYLEDLTGSRFAELKNDPAVWQLGASVYQTVKQHQFHRRGLYNDVSTWLRENVLSTGEVACPTLLLYDREDPFAPFCHAEYAATSIAGSQLVELHTGGHLIWFGRDADLMHARRVAFLREHLTGITGAFSGLN